MNQPNQKAEPRIVSQEIAHAEALRQGGEPDEALRLASAYLNDHFDDVPALMVMAHCLIDAKRIGHAYQLLKRASQIAPNEAIIWNNLGHCFQEGSDLDQGEQYLYRALKLEPENAIALNNLALMHLNRGDPQRALLAAGRAVSIDPKLSEARYNVGLSKLMMGDWAEGWIGYENNLGPGKPRRQRIYPGTEVWNGENGKTIIAYGEQGIGDEISFASCLPDLTRNNTVFLDCDPRLVGIFRRSFNTPTFGTRFKDKIGWHTKTNATHAVAFGSLPKFFRNSAADFPGRPYLVADPERRLQWRALMDSLGPKLKIGIAWTGGKKDTGTARRSIDLVDLLPILRQDATFISLQYKPAPEVYDVERTHGVKIHHWPHALHTNDYDDTAALVAECDLVISVTTAVIHLCGALGKPCWVMAPNAPMWRYGLSGDRMPWYGSVKLYRQSRQWVETIAQVAADLRDHIKPPLRSVH